MSPDLEALSREIAATSDAWMVPGMEAICDGFPALLLDRGEISGLLLAVDCNGQTREVHPSLCRPNLGNSVTVNSLLGATGNAWQDVCGGIVWMACVDNAAVVVDEDRTTAICRAWIAANKGK